MPSKTGGPPGISRGITPEQIHVLEDTWSKTQTPTQDEVRMLRRYTGLSANKVQRLVIQ